MTKLLKSRITEETGLAEKILVGVIAWALAAVIMLTSTLVTANQIDDTVAYIRTQTSPIDEDLDNVKLAEETNRIAKEIELAAAPLSGQLDQVLAVTPQIQQSAAQIDATAGEINSLVGAIFANASEINGTAKEINAKVHSINGHVSSIHGNVMSINSNVDEIHGSFVGINDVVPVIRGDHSLKEGGGGLAGAARRVDVLIGLITGIKSDTGNILALVGSIEKTAKSIDSKL